MVAIRNVDVDPDAPIATWPYEALVTLTERGSITDWAILAQAIDRQPGESSPARSRSTSPTAGRTASRPY